MSDSRFTTEWFEIHREHFDRWLAPWLAGRPDPCWVLEIGSYEGRSAIWWCQELTGRPGARVICVDPWEEDDDSKYVMFGDHVKLPASHLRFIRNVKAWRPMLVDICGRSENVLQLLPDQAFDVVYVDGCHRDKEVRQDTLAALRLCKADGLIIFDDWYDREGDTWQFTKMHEFVRSGAAKALGPDMGHVERRGNAAVLERAKAGGR